MATCVVPWPVGAETDPALTGGGPVSGYSGSATPITDLQVTGTGNPTVPVKLRVSNGSLSMSTTTGITFTGPSTGPTLQFSGSMSAVNTALATLTYTRIGTGSDTLEASLVNAGEVFFPDNGHLYEYVSFTASWVNAKSNAESRSKYGAAGYLATVTSQAENDFVSARLLNAGWMGASDAEVEGAWKWVTGPENGTQFWSGAGGGSAVGGNYANWNSGEPNDSSSNEDCGQFLTGGTGKWNDLPCAGATLPGYVVEYGSDASPIEVSSANIAITTLPPNTAPDVASTLGSLSMVDGSWGANATPAVSFSLADPNATDTLRYRVQITTHSDFSSPVVDYVSSLAVQGARSFSVGQADGGGSYIVGSDGQKLADGSYYWRVKAIDQAGAESAYVAANGGAIAFKVDATAPTAPEDVATTTPTNNTLPTWSWSPAVDSGIGLAATPYTIEWSQTADFSSGVSNAIVATASYTHTIALSDGIWYVRVKAADLLDQDSSYSNLAAVTIDTASPTISGKSVSPGATSAEITWTTDEPASSQVVYGPTTGYGLQTTEANVSPGTTSHTVVLSGLASCTLFHYSVVSRDTLSQSASTSDATFKTQGCVPSVTPTPSESSQGAMQQPTPQPTTRSTLNRPISGTTPSTTPSPTPSPTVTPVSTSSGGQSDQERNDGLRTVTVKVLDNHGQPIKGALVVLHSDPMSAYTNQDGIATFTKVPQGDHRVEVSYKGQKSEQKLLVNDDATNVVTQVRLSAAADTGGLKWSWWWLVIIAGLVLGWLMVRNRRHHKVDGTGRIRP